MAGTTTNISIRIDADLKAQADALFAELGMNLSTAFNIFVRQCIRERRIPFEISLNQPNKEAVTKRIGIAKGGLKSIFPEPHYISPDDLDGHSEEIAMSLEGTELHG